MRLARWVCILVMGLCFLWVSEKIFAHFWFKQEVVHPQTASFIDVLTVNKDLIVSNYPESISKPGVIFERQVGSKRVKVVYYHHNVGNQFLRLKLTIQNRGDRVCQVRFFQGQGGPSKHGIYAGHQASKIYLDRVFLSESETVSVPAYQERTVVLHGVKPSMTSSGIFDFMFDRADDVWIQLSALDDTYPQVSQINDLKAGEKGYGYFSNATVVEHIVYDVTGMIRDIRVGGDPFFRDRENHVLLKGNYGVSYTYRFKMENPTKRVQKVRLWVTPSAGMLKSTFIVNDQMIETPLLGFKGNFSPWEVAEFVLDPVSVQDQYISVMPQPGSYYPMHLTLQTVSEPYL